MISAETHFMRQTTSYIFLDHEKIK